MSSPVNVIERLKERLIEEIAMLGVCTGDSKIPDELARRAAERMEETNREARKAIEDWGDWDSISNGSTG